MSIETAFVGIIDFALIAVVWHEVAGGGPTHAQLAVNTLHGADREAVEIEIVALGAVEEACLGVEVQVGFVPHLEVPVAHLVQAVALHDMLGEGAHECFPLGDARWVVAHAVAVPHLAQAVLFGDEFGEEAEFHKGAHTNGEHTVKDLVDVLPVIDGIALAVLEIDAHIIVEESVHAQVLEAALVMYGLQLLHPRGAQTLVHATGASADAPVMLQRPSLAPHVNPDFLRRGHAGYGQEYNR